jgi:hypothetical protein
MLVDNCTAIDLNRLDSIVGEGDDPLVFYDRWSFLLGDAVGGDPCGGRAACSGDPCGGRAACSGDPGDAERVRISESADSFIRALGAIPAVHSSVEELLNARIRTIVECA